MKHSITLCYITSRLNCEFDWFLDSLLPQVRDDEHVEVIAVDFWHGKRDLNPSKAPWLRHVPVKPNVWQGEHKLTSREWWSVSASRNTGICLCNTDWIAVCDDRCVLAPTYLDAIRDAMNGNYVVAGAYEKRHHMTVEGGFITHPGIVAGRDSRARGRPEPVSVGGSWFFGCTSAMPLEWALDIGGNFELCDSLGLEDCIMGQMLELNKRPIMYDERMLIIEDRTPGVSEYPTARSDYGRSPKDKSHRLLDMTRGKLTCPHDFNPREVRARLARGEGFPIPTGPTHDFFTGVALKDMVPQ